MIILKRIFRNVHIFYRT